MEELLEVDPVLGVALEQAVEEVGEEGGGARRDPGRQPAVLLVELLQGLRGLRLNQPEYFIYMSGAVFRIRNYYLRIRILKLLIRNFE